MLNVYDTLQLSVEGIIIVYHIMKLIHIMKLNLRYIQYRLSDHELKY